MVHKAAYDAEHGFKIWSLKQIPQRLPITLAQVKVDNTSQN